MLDLFRTGAVGLVAMSCGVVGQPLFVDLAGDVGLGDYVATTGDAHGPGGVFTDLNLDGYPDLYLVHGSEVWSGNVLYVNASGAGDGRTFLAPAGAMGANDAGPGTGAIAGDYDNDGDLDLYVTNFDGPNTLLRSMLVEGGDLKFVDVTASTDPTPGVDDDQFGVGIAYYDGVALDNSVTAAWSDVDRDGDLDLYVGNHNGWYLRPIEGPFDLPGRRDVFYLNNGDGTFTEATMASRVPGFVAESGGFQTDNQRFSSTNAVIFADFNNDRWPDLLVTNKIGGPDDRDMLYMNLGVREDTGEWLGFEAVSHLMSEDFGRLTPAAMGVDVADIDHDGDLDFYMTDISALGEGSNDLWINMLSESGVLWFEHASGAAPWYDAPAAYSWGTQFQDFDNDGDLELHVATHETDADVLYLNVGPGFLDVGAPAGVAQARDSRGDMTADYNRDGFVDLFVVNLWDGPSALYHNLSGATGQGGRFLTVRLEGRPNAPGKFRTSRDAIGARVTARADLDGDGEISASEVQMREVVSGSSNAASTSSLELEFGMGVATSASLTVDWPSGRTSLVDLETNQFVTIVESESCAADLTEDGTLDIFDVVAFLGLLDDSDPVADWNGDTSIDIFDVLAYLKAFDLGC